MSASVIIIPDFFRSALIFPNFSAATSSKGGRDVPVLRIPTELADIVDTYIDRKLMPADPRGDALHLATASFHCCHFLLTWNCRHLANANKFDQIRRVNTLLGLFVPTLATPAELLWGG